MATARARVLQPRPAPWLQGNLEEGSSNSRLQVHNNSYVSTIKKRMRQLQAMVVHMRGHGRHRARVCYQITGTSH